MRLILLFLGIAINFASSADTLDNAFHHHIHNFSSNYEKPDKENYLAPHRHAVEMGYTMITRGTVDKYPYSELGVIKLLNAKVAPMRIDVPRKKIMYHDFYGDKNGTSLFRNDRKVRKWYNIDNEDIQLIKELACANESTRDLTIDKINKKMITKMFNVRWSHKGRFNLVANWQSKAALKKLVGAAKISIESGDYSAVFLDSLGGQTKYTECKNDNYPDIEKYNSWADGQLAFIQGLQKGVNKKLYYFGNIFNVFPKDGNTAILRWYKQGKLRLDHYYLESGRNIKANGIDPETGLPAFVSSDGFLPANRVSVDTIYGWYGSSRGKRHFTGESEYFYQHIKAAIIAAEQGSWFGWYGEDNVDKKDEEKNKYVYNNSLQLLRAIPNWDNLANIKLADRKADLVNNIYQSSRSYITDKIIYSRHFKTGELFVVFNSNKGELKLNPREEIEDARFSNRYFGSTSESALSCLKVDNNLVKLTCPDRIGTGIRIKLKAKIKG